MRHNPVQDGRRGFPLRSGAGVIAGLVCLVFFVCLFIVFDMNFQGPDQPIYYAYTASICENRDLNVVTQMADPARPFQVTETYNYPDYHNHGGVVFWAPFYLYGKLSYGLAGKVWPALCSRYSQERVIRSALSFSTVFFTVLTFLLVYLFCSAFFSRRLSLLATIAVFFGTPFFDCAIFETGNANVIIIPFAVISLWFCQYAGTLGRRDWFLYGLFFSMCLALKTEMAFQLLLIGSLLLLVLRPGKRALAAGLLFCAGLFPGLALRLVNDVLKYGSLHVGEAGVFTARNFYFFEQLFSSYRGFLYTSPLFYLCLIGFCLLARDAVRQEKNSDRGGSLFLVLAGLYLAIKIFLLSFRYAWGGGTPGARILLTEAPVIALLYAAAFKSRQRPLRMLVALSSLLCISWNIITVYEYYRSLDIAYLAQTPGMGARFRMLPQALRALVQPRDVDLKLYFDLPLLAAGCWCIFYLARRLTAAPFSPSPDAASAAGCRTMLLRATCGLTIFLYVSYGAVTLLNWRNNRYNVEALAAAGFFKNASVIKPGDFERRENISSFKEMIEYYSAKGDAARVERIKRLQKELYNE